MISFSFFSSFTVWASLVMLCLNIFSFVCLFYRIEFFKKWRPIIAVLLILMTIVEVYYFSSFRHSSVNVPMLQFSSSLIGITFSLFFFSIVYFILRIPLFTIKFSDSRRRALKLILDVTIIISIVSWVIKGFTTVFSKPIKRIVKVNIKDISSPLSIVQITDVHIGKVLGFEFMKSVVDAANELDGDIVVITGDLVDLPSAYMREKLEPLRDLKSRFGVYFVLGNHEYFYGDIKDTIKLVESFNIKVLKNESVLIDNRINLAGIYDLRGDKYNQYKPDLKKALQNTNNGLPTILLSHQPKIINRISDNDNIDLVISGHTHGGQIFPFGLLVLIDQPYLYGLYKHDDKTQIFISSGVGYWGPPMRVLAPSEVVKLELKPL